MKFEVGDIFINRIPMDFPGPIIVGRITSYKEILHQYQYDVLLDTGYPEGEGDTNGGFCDNSTFAQHSIKIEKEELCLMQILFG